MCFHSRSLYWWSRKIFKWNAPQLVPPQLTVFGKWTLGDFSTTCSGLEPDAACAAQEWHKNGLSLKLKIWDAKCWITYLHFSECDLLTHVCKLHSSTIAVLLSKNHVNSGRDQQSLSATPPTPLSEFREWSILIARKMWRRVQDLTLCHVIQIS